MKIVLDDTNTVVAHYKDDVSLPASDYWIYSEDPTHIPRPTPINSSVHPMQQGDLRITERKKIIVNLTSAQIAYHVRKRRDELLAKSDWTQVNDAPIPAEKRGAWLAYRQRLRDITKQLQTAGINGRGIVWPIAP